MLLSSALSSNQKVKLINSTALNNVRTQNTTCSAVQVSGKLRSLHSKIMSVLLVTLENASLDRLEESEWVGVEAPNTLSQCCSYECGLPPATLPTNQGCHYHAQGWNQPKRPHVTKDKLRIPGRDGSKQDGHRTHTPHYNCKIGGIKQILYVYKQNKSNNNKNDNRWTRGSSNGSVWY